MQADTTTVQLPPAPLRPTCHQIFNTGPCADSWRNYNQAVEQWNRLYVNRQKDLASLQATTPLQQQIIGLKSVIADQQAQITQYQQQMKIENYASQATGIQRGAILGVVATLLLLGAVSGIKKLTSRFTVTKKPRAQAAAIGK